MGPIIKTLTFTLSELGTHCRIWRRGLTSFYWHLTSVLRTDQKEGRTEASRPAITTLILGWFRVWWYGGSKKWLSSGSAVEIKPTECEDCLMWSMTE